jgi:hypothetical protein
MRSEFLASGDDKKNCVWYNINHTNSFPEAVIYHYRYPEKNFSCRQTERPQRREKKGKSDCRKFYLTATPLRQSSARVLTIVDSLARLNRSGVTMRIVRSDSEPPTRGQQVLDSSVQFETAPPNNRRRTASVDETANRRRRQSHAARRSNGRLGPNAASRLHSHGAAAAVAVVDADGSSSSLSRQTEFRPIDEVDAS